MSRLQAIENALAAINPAVFQELCDSFLAIRNSNYSAFSRTGSQSGKQKTVPGTPDTFLLLPNGRYIFVEHSTNISDGINKLIADINKCLDVDKTGVPLSEIQEIILCINFNLDTNEMQQIKEISYSTGIEITVYTIDALAIELHMHHRDLSHQYLGLPLDTGQIVLMDRFIEEYNKAANGIATPLNNTFLYRENELISFKQAIHDNDFIILTGSPGVGKTKLALEGFKSFLSENLTYSAFCISYKSHTLLDDLYQYFEDEKDYLLFVDDANRIDAFGQITGFYKKPRKGKLKIIVTVRDYAYQEMHRLCQEFSPKPIELSKFSDDQIIGIISAEPFEILNPDYQKEIVRIADGNPRLGIMAARLAKDKQNIYVLHDVSELFEKYFSTFVRDNDDFGNVLNFKCLALISFFYTIPYKDKEITSAILKDFDIEYSAFVETIDKLDKLELVEIRYDHVKVPEQNLATFFFYQAVLKDKLLSFPTLLNLYFDSNKGRFTECVISANNTFGYENVMGKLLPDLRTHWKKIYEFDCKAVRFLSVFWFYMQPETLAYIYSKVSILPDAIVEEYDTKYERNKFSFSPKDETIELIGENFRFSIELKDCLDLAIEYCRKKPELVPELINKLREKLAFDRHDENDDFLRQKTLFKVLIDGADTGDRLSNAILFEMALSLLEQQYQQTKSGRGDSFYWYKYSIPNIPSIKELRKSIWDAINRNFKLQSDAGLEILEKFIIRNFDNDKKIQRFDLQFILRIIKRHFYNNDIKHIKYVKDLQLWCKKSKIVSKTLDKISLSFNSSTYELFCVLDWDKYRDKEIFEFDDWREYDDLKEAEIRANVIIKDNNEVTDFIEQYSLAIQVTKNRMTFSKSLDIIIDQTLKTDFAIGLKLIKEIIKTGNKEFYIPRIVYINHLKDAKSARCIWDLICCGEYGNKSAWELIFFDFLDDSQVNEFYTGELIKSVQRINWSYIISFNNLERFCKIDPNLFLKILKTVVEKNDLENLKIKLWMDFFTRYIKYIDSDMPLVKKAYLQQEFIQDSNDHDCSDLLAILNLCPEFLQEYVEAVFANDNFPIYGNSKNMNVVWRVPGIEVHLTSVLDYIFNSDIYYSGTKDFSNSFFSNLQNEEKSRAKHFLLDYLKSNINDCKKNEAVINISRHAMNEFFEEFLLYFISITQDVAVFSRIPWRGNSTSGSGNQILADIEMADWKRIETIVAKSTESLKLIPIKKFISDQLDYCQRRGDIERERKFTRGF